MDQCIISDIINKNFKIVHVNKYARVNKYVFRTLTTLIYTG